MKNLFLFTFLILSFNILIGQKKHPVSINSNNTSNTRSFKTTSKVWTADNGDGTYKNPLFWGDWADPDFIRVDDDFYFVSTSMQYVPGCPILHSKDLVNWEMAGYAVDQYKEDPRYNLQGGSLYKNGSWASTIRHHNGLFYVGFCTPKGQGNKEGCFSICTSKDIKGPWTRTIFPEYMYDPGLFFDDDGKVYIAHGQEKLYITELNADALSVKTPQKEIYNNRDYPYLEGSHVYKVNGKYYILATTGGTKGRQVCLRSDNIYGPYESKVILRDDATYPGNFLHQGGMLQLKDGSWWFMIMQDRGTIGRSPHLEPVTWVDGWPMLGVDGKGVTIYKKPNVGKTYPVKVPATSDEFNTSTLGLQWQWNHNPDNQKWSLTERKGYMRLHASLANDLSMARNTLTQRIQGPVSEGIVEMDATNLKNGNVAGFGILQLPHAYIAVRKNKTGKTLLMVNNRKVIDSINDFRPNKIWLKANVTHIGYKVSFSYSVDGKQFIPFGNQLNMDNGYSWTSNRFALLNYSTKKEGIDGYADFNWFHFKGENNIQNQKITYNGNSLNIDGKETFIYSAAFHYFRCPKELWRDRFKKIKAAGFNTVETYIPWNWHEQNMPKNINDYSQVDFSDLQDWLYMAQTEFGFYTIVRPGPFICAEWAGGGYPRWLAKFRPNNLTDFWLRSNDPEHVKWSLHWYNAVNKFIANEQITQKSKGEKGIIMVQIENEYDADDSKDKTKFLQSLYSSVKSAGITVPIFTCLTSQTRGSKDSVLSQVFDCDNYYVGLNDAISCAKRMSDLKRKQPNAPGFVTELQGGWFSTVGGRLAEEHYSDAKHFYAIGMMSILGGATGINYYMFYGGTHFAGWGARGQTTSYDYNAAIREDGSLSKKYFASANIGKFIKKYEQQLIHSKGGICSFEKAAAELVGGVRIADDGTKFVFIHNNSAKKKIAGTALVNPGVDTSIAKPIYNVNQNEEKVLITADAKGTNELANEKPFKIKFELDSLETKVLIIPAKATATKGSWWSMQEDVKKKTNTNQPKVSIPVKKVLAFNENFDANWKTLTPNVSLPELGINDLRYVLYRSQESLTKNEANQFSKLLFNTFSRDIINVQVNGKLATRLYPTEDYASKVTRNIKKSYAQIKDNEYDNIFDVAGLLHAGTNEIIVVYENIGHEHGYYPMEELCGIKTAGLSNTTSSIQKTLQWQVATDLAGIEHGFIKLDFNVQNWKEIELDTTFTIPRKGNDIQPKGKQDALFTWYRTEFELPANVDPATTWRLLINASGNGYIYLNGHNIGRHWEAGPQREFYLPECWLRFGKNEKNTITLGLRQTTNGAVIKGMEIKEY